MAKVLLLSSAPYPPFDPWKHGTELVLRRSAEVDSFGVHSLTDNQREADIILFAEMGECGIFAERVRAHPCYRDFPEKCYLFDIPDVFFPILPGLYASLTRKQYEAGHARTGHYLYFLENTFVDHRPLQGNESYLAAFVGSRKNALVRRKLFDIQRPDFLLRDTSDITYRIQYHGQPDERTRFWADYANDMASATFSLCPRGVGAGSIRLFESMKMGRPCVILADDWHRQQEIDWESFSITVREREVDRLPEILERNQHRAAEMGEAARREWERWFSEPVRFHHAVEACLDIQRHQSNKRWRHYYHIRYLADPRNWRKYLSSKRNLYNRDGKLYW